MLNGYVERLRPTGDADPAPTTIEYRDRIVNWVIDLQRGLDYLETRKDLDTGRITFFGISAGARVGLIMAAVETRYHAVSLVGSGLRKVWTTWVEGASPTGFVSHIHGPKLMVHGRYDENLSLKTEAEPLFRLLPEPKRLVLYDGGHIPPFEFLIPTVNGWLDETLGPVKRE